MMRRRKLEKLALGALLLLAVYLTFFSSKLPQDSQTNSNGPKPPSPPQNYDPEHGLPQQHAKARNVVEDNVPEGEEEGEDEGRLHVGQKNGHFDEDREEEEDEEEEEIPVQNHENELVDEEEDEEQGVHQNKEELPRNLKPKNNNNKENEDEYGEFEETAPENPTPPKSALDDDKIKKNVIPKFTRGAHIRMEVKSNPKWQYKGVDAAHMHGAIGVNEDGSPAWTPSSMPPEDTPQQKREHHKPNCFNLARSDSLALDRAVPDYRHEKCEAALKNYTLSTLPKASIVFVFFNEPFSPLFRSVHSVLNRSPPELVHEIILVDDGSDAPWLQEPLEDYVEHKMPKLFLKRREVREGLMAARTTGAMAATGEVVVFLDSHIEVSNGWLEPLLARIHEDPKHVVMPVIEGIDADSFKYSKGGIDILGFSFSLGQRPIRRPRSDFEPMPSPIMAGGLFAMDLKLFKDLGGYDPEMKLYGGEEMEIAFRIWQCGATLECLPCSRVGHIFRTSKYYQGQVYPVPGSTILRNKLRAAEVWMDEYKFIVQRVMGDLPEGMSLGPLEYMTDIRKRHNCKSFKWFLDNVFPELFIPFETLDDAMYGELKNLGKINCVDTLGATHVGDVMGLYSCHGRHGTQEFMYSPKTKEIRIADLGYEMCLGLDESGKQVISVHCVDKENRDPTSLWEYDTKSRQFSQNGNCMSASTKQTSKSLFSLTVEPCKDLELNQQWVWSNK